MTAWRTIAEPFDADHPCLPGHFPDRPIVPGTLILERVVERLLERFPERRLGGLVSVKFLSPLQPAQPLSIHFDSDGDEVGFECLRDQTKIAAGKLRLTRREPTP